LLYATAQAPSLLLGLAPESQGEEMRKDSVAPMYLTSIL
jgi:hypothetical protein